MTHPSTDQNLLRSWLFWAWVVALVAALGSLFFGEVMKLPPCTLCWYQRICLYPLVVLLPVGILRGDDRVHLYALPLVVIGLGIAGYHNLLYYGVIPRASPPAPPGRPATPGRSTGWASSASRCWGWGPSFSSWSILLLHGRPGRPVTVARGQHMNKQAKVLGIAAVALVGATVLGGRAVFALETGRPPRRRRRPPPAASSDSVYVRPHSHIIGPADAKVTIVEFLDPECETCRAMYPMVKQVLHRVPGQGAAGGPLHAVSSELAVRRQRPGGGGRAEEVLGDAGGDVRQPSRMWADHHHPRPELIPEIAKQVGLDMDAFNQALSKPAHKQKVQMDEADGKTLGVTGTPTFFVNGKMLQELGYEPLRALVAQQAGRRGQLNSGAEGDCARPSPLPSPAPRARANNPRGQRLGTRYGSPNGLFALAREAGEGRGEGLRRSALPPVTPPADRSAWRTARPRRGW